MGEHADDALIEALEEDQIWDRNELSRRDRSVATKKKHKAKKSQSGRNGAGVHRPRPRPNRLQELRKKGVVLSQIQVGKLLGWDAATVSRHESGERGLTRDQIIGYATLFGVSTFEIYMEADETLAPELVMATPSDELESRV